jgi:hypothetical protein
MRFALSTVLIFRFCDLCFAAHARRFTPDYFERESFWNTRAILYFTTNAGESARLVALIKVTDRIGSDQWSRREGK